MIRKVLLATGAAVLVTLLVASMPHPVTLESMKAACVSAPEPDDCMAEAMARVYGRPLETAQSAAVDKASGN